MKKLLSVFIIICTLTCGLACNSIPTSYSKGVYNNNEYTNDYTVLSFTLPENYEFKSQSELAEMDVLNDDKLVVDYHMYAVNAKTQESIIIAAEFLNNDKITASDYLERFLSTIGQTAETTAITLGEDSFSAATIDNEGVMQRICTKYIDNCMLIVTISGQSLESIEELCTYFN